MGTDDMNNEVTEKSDKNRIPTYMTLSELSGYLKIPMSTLQKWRHEKGLPFIKIGRALRFNRDEVVRWFQGYQQTTTKKKEGD
jgi:excisionase family DNA binding protein